MLKVKWVSCLFIILLTLGVSTVSLANENSNDANARFSLLSILGIKSPLKFLDQSINRIQILSKKGDIIKSFPVCSKHMEWDATDRSGDQVAPGEYIIKLTGTGDTHQFIVQIPADSI